MTPSTKDVTQLLNDWSSGNKEAQDKLIPLVYEELRGLAQRYLRQEHHHHTLQTTALVELFRATLEREGSQRAAFLDETCAADPSLRGEVESLIASHEQMGGFLDKPVLADAPELPTDDQTQFMVGRHIGSHKVTREIGHGGMGEVYLAERVFKECERVSGELSEK